MHGKDRVGVIYTGQVNLIDGNEQLKLHGIDRIGIRCKSDYENTNQGWLLEWEKNQSNSIGIENTLNTLLTG